MNDDLKQRLTGFFAAHLPAAQELTLIELTRNTEGWSLETYAVALAYRVNGKEKKHSFIIRKEPLAGLLDPYDCSIEYRTLKALMPTPVVAPRVFWYEKNPEIMGRPFYVMEKVEGTVPIPHIIKDEKGMQQPTFPDPEERKSLAADFVEILGQLHRVDWRARGLDFLGAPEPGRDVALRQVAHWEKVIRDHFLQPLPLVTYLSLWLRANAPETDEITVVHGDYRTGNFIARQGRIAAILDWEMVHLGDPMEDISYIISPHWRSGPPERLISFLLSDEEFNRRYEELTGIKMDAGRIFYYNLLNGLKALAIGLTAGHAVATGRSSDLRTAVFHYRFYATCYLISKALAAF